ncbi:MAG: hypothetical protein ACRDKW_02850 [Actinomycetota bacterium]
MARIRRTGVRALSPISEDLPFVRLHQAEAVELSELCAFVAGLLTAADEAVERSLDRHVGSNDVGTGGYRFERRDDLVRWSEMLLGRETTR